MAKFQTLLHGIKVPWRTDFRLLVKTFLLLNPFSFLFFLIIFLKSIFILCLSLNGLFPSLHRSFFSLIKPLTYNFPFVRNTLSPISIPHNLTHSLSPGSKYISSRKPTLLQYLEIFSFSDSPSFLELYLVQLCF